MPVIIVHAERNEQTIAETLGTAEYSYYFVLQAFRPLLGTLGTVVTVEDDVRVESTDGPPPATYDLGGQVDAIFDICRRVGEPCVFLSFTPPHRTLVGLRCPTIPVFAWEFSDLPNESWHGEARHDWRFVLRTLGGAITHSEFAARVVGKSLGVDFPVASIPAPIWNRFTRPSDAAGRPPDLGERTVELVGVRLDTRSSAAEQQGLARAPRSTSTLDRDAARGRQQARRHAQCR